MFWGHRVVGGSGTLSQTLRASRRKVVGLCGGSVGGGGFVSVGAAQGSETVDPSDMRARLLLLGLSRSFSKLRNFIENTQRFQPSLS